MKILFIIIVFIIPISFVNGQYKKTSEVIGKIKSIKQMTYLAEDVWGVTKIIEPEKDDYEIDEVEKNYYLINFNKGLGYELINYNANGHEYSKKIKKINKNVIETIYFESDTAQKLILSSKIIEIYSNRKHNILLQSKIYDSRDSLIKSSYYNYGRKGRLLSLMYYDSRDSLLKSESYQYNKKGNLLHSTVMLGQELFSKTIYNKKGQIMEIHYYQNILVIPLGSPIPFSIKEIYTYDKKANLIEYILYKNDTVKIEQQLYIYNNHCKLIEFHKTKFTHDSGRFQTKVIQKYNSKNKLVEETEFNQDKVNIDKMYTYVYDNQNNIIFRKEYDFKGRLQCTIFEYEYDKKGNWIVRKKFKDGYFDEFYLTIRNIEYK